MLKSNYSNTKKPLNRLFVFIATYWKELSIVAIVGPFLYRYYLNQMALNDAAKKKAVKTVSNNQNKQYNPTTQKQKIDLIFKNVKFKDSGQRERIINAAKVLPFHLGTQFLYENEYVELSINHSSWTENDDEIEKILIANPVNYWLIEKLYHDVFTQSRNLTSDVLKYLDSSNLKRVRAAWKKYNKFI